MVMSQAKHFLNANNPKLLTLHRGDGKQFVVRAAEKLTAFVELELAIRARGLLDLA